MQFYETNICRIKIFSLHTFYKNHDDDKKWQSNQRKIENIIASARIILLPTVVCNFICVNRFKRVEKNLLLYKLLY